MARKTQLQGDKEHILFKRNPEPCHCVQLFLANANVSDRVHSILTSFQEFLFPALRPKKERL